MQIINWHPVATSLPDSDITVMVALDGDSEPVWMAHFDGAAWISVSDGTDITAEVTHWADIPEGPES